VPFNLIELDDTYVGGKKAGKRGRGAEGKKPVLVAVEKRGRKAGFIAMTAVSSISKKNVRYFVEHHFRKSQTVITDAFRAMNSVKETDELSMALRL